MSSKPASPKASPREPMPAEPAPPATQPPSTTSGPPLSTLIDTTSAASDDESAIEKSIPIDDVDFSNAEDLEDFVSAFELDAHPLLQGRYDQAAAKFLEFVVSLRFESSTLRAFAPSLFGASSSRRVR